MTARGILPPWLPAAALVALLLPSEGAAEDVRWLVQDAEDAALWEAVAGLVARDAAVSIQVWEGPWPPAAGAFTPADGEGGPSAAVGMERWDCWLLEGDAPSIEVRVPGRAESLRIPLESAGGERGQRVRAAVMLTQSLRRTIAIADAGWMPTEELAALLGARIVSAEPDPPPSPVEPAVTPEDVVPPPFPATAPRTRAELAVGLGATLRPGDGGVALGAHLGATAVRGPWIGPGAVVGLEVLGGLDADERRVGLARLLVAARWQFTPASGGWSFPLGVGAGIAVTRAWLAEPAGGDRGTGVPPVVRVDLGVRRSLGRGFTLGLTLEAGLDLIPVRIVVERGPQSIEADIPPFSLAPRMELAFGPPPR